jgi:hypothetical protein
MQALFTDLDYCITALNDLKLNLNTLKTQSVRTGASYSGKKKKPEFKIDQKVSVLSQNSLPVKQTKILSIQDIYKKQSSTAKSTAVTRTSSKPASVVTSQKASRTNSPLTRPVQIQNFSTARKTLQVAKKKVKDGLETENNKSSTEIHHFSTINVLPPKIQQPIEIIPTPSRENLKPPNKQLTLESIQEVHIFSKNLKKLSQQTFVPLSIDPVLIEESPLPSPKPFQELSVPFLPPAKSDSSTSTTELLSLGFLSVPEPTEPKESPRPTEDHEVKPLIKSADAVSKIEEPIYLAPSPAPSKAELDFLADLQHLTNKCPDLKIWDSNNINAEEAFFDDELLMSIETQQSNIAKRDFRKRRKERFAENERGRDALIDKLCTFLLEETLLDELVY